MIYVIILSFPEILIITWEVTTYTVSMTRNNLVRITNCDVR